MTGACAWMTCHRCRVRQILSLFLALLLSSFSYENLKKSQQQDQDGVDNNDDDDDDEDESEITDNQMAAAFERLQRWAKFLTARLGLLRRRLAALMDDAASEHGDGRLIATWTTDTACDLTTTPKPNSTSAALHSPQPALLVDCSDRQVILQTVA